MDIFELYIRPETKFEKLISIMHVLQGILGWNLDWIICEVCVIIWGMSTVQCYCVLSIWLSDG